MANLSGWGFAAVDLALQIVLFPMILIAVIAQGWLALFMALASIAAYAVMVDAFVPLKPRTARDTVRAKSGRGFLGGNMDEDLTAEQAERLDKLSAEELGRIDSALMSHAKTQPRKVAMVVGLAMIDLGKQIKNVPDVFYAKRVAHLVALGKLQAIGDLRRMGHSEVCLPGSGPGGRSP